MDSRHEYVQVPVSGWLVDWVRKLSRASGHQVVLHEQVRGVLDDEAQARVLASMGRQLRAEMDEYVAREGLVVLAEGPIEHRWCDGYVMVVWRFLAMERAPVPPVEEWGRTSWPS